MPEAVNYIVLAIPVFFFLIGIEILVDKFRHTGYYRFNDAVTNINAGITEQVTGAFLKAFVFGIYAWLFERFHLFEIRSNTVTWILLFIGVDFCYYWFHRLAHEVNVLWGGHVVHHQSEEYNLSVALRQGAFQKFGSFAFYLPLSIIGFNPIMFIIISQIQTLYQFWIHTKTIHKLPAPVEFIFNTPSHHRVHHGRNPVYIDKNHGGTLIIWDRMFGTFQPELEEVVYGITRPLNTWNPIRVQLDFWKELMRELMHSRKFADRVKLLFYAPGWHSVDSGGPQYAPPVTAQTAVKYDTQVPRSLNYYVFFQFVVILGITTLFLLQFDAISKSLLTAFLILTFILFAITSLGIILEGKKQSIWVESCRLASCIALYLYISQVPNEITLPVSGWYLLIIYVLVSLFIFIPLTRKLRT